MWVKIMLSSLSHSFFNLIPILLFTLLFPSHCLDNNYWYHELWSETIKVHLKESIMFKFFKNRHDSTRTKLHFSIAYSTSFFSLFSSFHSFLYIHVFIDWDELIMNHKGEGRREEEMRQQQHDSTSLPFHSLLLLRSFLPFLESLF